MQKIFLSLFLIIANAALAVAPAQSVASFKTEISFAEGTSSNQLSWNQDENGVIPGGPFQGPMAFACDDDHNLWICDSLNSRIVKVDKAGKKFKAYDLAAVAKKTGITHLALVDIAISAQKKVICADAGNNLIIEFDPESGKLRSFASPKSETGLHWNQINHIHTDDSGNIYIEDVSRLQTLVIDKNGKPLQNLPGLLSIAVSPDSHLAMTRFEEKHPNFTAVYIASKPGDELKKNFVISDKKPILWSRLLGFDEKGNLFIVYQTASRMSYQSFKPDGTALKKCSIGLSRHGYEPGRGHWINKKGDIFTAKIAGKKLEIMKLHWAE